MILPFKISRFQELLPLTAPPRFQIPGSATEYINISNKESYGRAVIRSLLDLITPRPQLPSQNTQKMIPYSFQNTIFLQQSYSLLTFICKKKLYPRNIT